MKMKLRFTKEIKNKASEKIFTFERILNTMWSHYLHD